MRWKAWLLSSSLVLPVLVTPPIVAWAQQHPPDAATRTRARANFQGGVAAYTRGDFSVALESFLSAYRLAPHPTVRVNIANCYMQLHQPVDALTYFEAFLVESPNAPAEQRGDVQRQIEELRGQIAEVHVGLSPDGVHDPIVSVDGHATANQNVVRMMPGHHIIEASAEGYQPERTEIDATPGLRRELVVRLRTIGSPAATNTAVATANPSPTPTTTTTTAGPVPAATSEAPTSTTTPPVVAAVATNNAPVQSSAGSNDVDVHPTDHRTLSPTFFYAGAAVTGVALISWAAFGIAALVNNGVYEDARSQIQTGNDVLNQMDRGYGALQNTQAFALASDISLGVTVIAAGASVFLFTRTRFDNRPAVAIAPMGGNGVGGILVGGRF